MGVTIHFEGKLKSQDAYIGLIERAEQIAGANTWLTEKFEHSDVTLLRVRDEKDWDYKGPTKGVIVYIHEDCDPVRLEFDENLYIQEYVKTQFAGVPIHITLVNLLRDFQDYFIDLVVNDEGEYWESGDEAVLGEHIRCCAEVIAEEASKTPSAQVKVRSPDGRLIDLIR